MLRLGLAGSAICASFSFAESGRIKTLFDKYPTFGEDLLLETFNEKASEEFLLTETEDLLDELVTEFSDWLEKTTIGEKTHEGRLIELVSFKE